MAKHRSKLPKLPLPPSVQGEGQRPQKTMADVSIRAVGAAANTSTGTQDITLSGFGTPKAALFIVTSATAPNTDTQHAQFSIGATDGTNSRVAAVRAEDNLTTASDTSRARSDADVIYMPGPTTDAVNFEANFDSWITDGVRINITNAPPSAYLITVILFNGADLSAHVNNISASATIGGTSSVTGFGFEADQIIAFGAQANFTPATNNHAYLQLGFADNGASITQGGWSIAWRDAQIMASVGAELAAAIDYDHIIHRLTSNSTGAAVNSPKFELTSFDADGITITTRNVANGGQFAFLALNYNGGDHWMGTVTSPTSTGLDTISGVGFTPQAILGIMTGTSSASNASLTNDEAGMAGFAVATADEEFTSIINGDDSVSTTDHSSFVVADALYHEDKAANSIEASLSAFNSDGWVFSYSAVRASGFKFFYLAVESAGQALIRRVDEAVEIAEEARRLVTFLRRVDEAVELSEDVRRNLGLTRRVDETVEVAEDVRRNLGLARMVEENVQVAEDIRRLVGFIRRTDESVEIAETVYRTLGLVRRTDEGVEVDESIWRFIGLIRRVDESVEVDEEIRRFLGFVIRLDEGVEIGEEIRSQLAQVLLSLATKLSVARAGLYKGRVQGPLAGD